MVSFFREENETVPVGRPIQSNTERDAFESWAGLRKVDEYRGIGACFWLPMNSQFYDLY